MEIKIPTSYAFYLKGEKPLPLVKVKIDEMKENGEENHPLTRAKRYELVSIPPNVRHDDYLKLFLEQETSTEDTIYVCILDMGITMKEEEVTEPTGRCKTQNVIHKGQRKWETQHVVYEIKEDDELIEVGGYVTKGEAMDFAKAYVTDHAATVKIELERRLVGSDSHIATLEPEIRTFIKRTEIPHNQFLVFGKGETIIDGTSETEESDTTDESNDDDGDHEQNGDYEGFGAYGTV